MKRSYRRRCVPVTGALAVGIIVFLLAAALLLRGCGTGGALTEDGAGAPGAQQPPREQSPSQAPPPAELPTHVTTPSGIACTLTELGEEAVYTGELILVNNWSFYHFPDQADLTNIYENKSDSYIVARTDTEIAPAALEALNTMMDDFRQQGGSKSVNVVAGYRTEAFQQHLFDQSAERSGLEHAKKYVAQPGGSEHHTGYAVDLSVLNRDGSSSDYDGSGEYAWINGNCHSYGYIVRYETGKEELTGIWDEPWHFRYLGVPHATKVAELGLCLEEYTDWLKDYTFDGEHLTISCAAGEYEVWYTQGTQVYLPDDGAYTVSGNNVDGVIVTCKLS